jgi:hypothetical protein
MIVIVGLIVLLAAVIVGVAGVLSNDGHAHALPHGFAVFGYHVTGSTGHVFLAGIVVGAAAVVGLSLLLAGARRTSRRGSAARRGLRQSRQETAAVSQDRDDLIGQRDTARAYTASNQDTSAARDGAPLAQDDSRSALAQDDSRSAPAGGGLRSGLHMFGRRADPRPADAELPESLDSQPVSDVPANATESQGT